jgi:hypothetical protein
LALTNTAIRNAKAGEKPIKLFDGGRPFLLPIIKNRITDSDLPAHLFHQSAKLCLLECERDFLFGKFALLHDMTPVSSDENHAGNSTFKWHCFLG